MREEERVYGALLSLSLSLLNINELDHLLTAMSSNAIHEGRYRQQNSKKYVLHRVAVG